MSVELLLDHVVFPHRPDWRERVKWSRLWTTIIRDSVGGSEERVSMRPRGRVRLGFTVNPTNDVEAHQALDRLRAIVASGRAVVPYWGRGITLPTGASIGATVVDIAREPAWEWDNGDKVFLSDAAPRSFETWEVATLDRFKGDLKVRFSSPLTKAFPHGSRLYPLIFGRAKVGDLELLDDWHNAFAFEVEETSTRETPTPDTT